MKREWRPGQLLPYVRDADVVLVDHLPALPAGEEEEEDCEQRKPEANSCCGARTLRIAKIEIDELKDDGGHVPAGVEPSIIEIPDLNVAHHVDEACDSRQRCKDECNAEEPQAHSVPELVAAGFESDVYEEGAHKASELQFPEFPRLLLEARRAF